MTLDKLLLYSDCILVSFSVKQADDSSSRKKCCEESSVSMGAQQGAWLSEAMAATVISPERVAVLAPQGTAGYSKAIPNCLSGWVADTGWHPSAE